MEKLSKKLGRKPTIEDLEKILNSEENIPIEILPNGEIKVFKRKKKVSRVPLTLRENLGGEYGLAGI